MDSNFHPAVLQQPRHFGEDNSSNSSNREDRGRLRDILNPGSSVNPAPAGVPGHQPPTIMSTPSGAAGQGPPPAPTPPVRSHHHAASFSLRSPTRSSDFHNQPPPPPSLSYSTSPTNNNVTGSRSILNSHYMTSPAGGTSLPPPLQPPAGLTTSSSVPVAPLATGTSNLHAPDRSPLHAPPVYYPHDIRDRDRDRELGRDLREPSREKASTGSFYDPTTDIVTTSNGTTAKERQTADAAGSWHNNGAPKVSTPKVSPNFFTPLNPHAATPSLSLSNLSSHFSILMLSCHHQS